MTSLTVNEFEELCTVFSECWNNHTKQHEKDPAKGGRKHLISTMEDRLFFILFYLKTYPLQEVLAYSFEMSQSEANKLVHELSLVLGLALQKSGFSPARLPDDMLARLEQEATQDYSIDGTERPIIRPSDPEAQPFFLQR